MAYLILPLLLLAVSAFYSNKTFYDLRYEIQQVKYLPPYFAIHPN